MGRFPGIIGLVLITFSKEMLRYLCYSIEMYSCLYAFFMIEEETILHHTKD